MNKYSKRALKTTATVGMSLAMVMSAVAMPVSAAAESYGICKGLDLPTENVDCGQKVYLDVLDKLDSKKLSEITVDTDLKLEMKNGDKENLLAVIEDYKVELAAAAADTALGYREKAEITGWLNVTKAIEGYLGTGSLKDAEVKSTSDLNTVLKNVNNEDGKDEDWSTIDVDNYSDAKAALKVLKDFKADYGKYLGIVSNDDYASNQLADGVMEAYTTLNTNINDYLGVTADSDLSEFVIVFDAILQADLDGKEIDTAFLAKKVSKDNSKTYAQVLQGEKTSAVTSVTPAKLALNKKTDLKARMDMIKDHSFYDRFKDEDSVIAVMDSYQELIDNIGANSDVLKSDEYNAFIKTKVSNIKKDNKVTLKEFTKEANVEGKDAAERADTLAAMLNSEQWAILKAAKEEVMDNIYTMETRQIGNYYVDKSDYTTNATTAQQNTFKSTFPSYLYSLVDKEEGLFGYDVVSEHMESVVAALEAVTTGIEKMTPANIKATDKKTLEAAEDAIFELVDGKYNDNLTSAEKRTVRTADAKITNLREAFDNLGTTTVAGWYDMGNGNWGYNNEDGTPAAYKWVASGSNWYFVRDGKMARNTWLAANSTDWYYLGSDGKMATSVSVDGCWINSLGIYTK